MEFGKYASSYDENAFIQRDLIDWGLEGFEIKGKDVLELGAGTGYLTEKIFGMNPKSLVATDVCCAMVEIGRTRVPGTEWQTMDAWGALPGKVDLICSASLLHWAKDPVGVLRNWRGALNVGGKVHCLFFINRTLRDLQELGVPCGGVEWREANEWKKIFEDAGFRVERLRSEVREYGFSGAMELLKMLKLSGTSANGGYSGGRLKRAVKEYEQMYRRGEGVVSTWEFCEVTGKR